jgi:hypothetical protein
VQNRPESQSVALVLASVGITLCSGLALGAVSLLMAIGGFRPYAGTLAILLAEPGQGFQAMD